jgi:hypothetical protein
MVESLVVLVLGVDVLTEEYLEEFGLEEDVDQAGAHLHDGKVEDEDRADDRQHQVVVDVREAVVLFVLDVLDDAVVDVLLEGADGLVPVLEDLMQGGVVPAFPLWGPADLEDFVLADEVLVDVFEVEDIGSVLGDVLDVAADVVDGLASVREAVDPGRVLEGLEVGFYCGVGVQPYVNETVHLFGAVDALTCVFGGLFPLD